MMNCFILLILQDPGLISIWSMLNLSLCICSEFSVGSVTPYNGVSQLSGGFVCCFYLFK